MLKSLALVNHLRKRTKKPSCKQQDGFLSLFQHKQKKVSRFYG